MASVMGLIKSNKAYQAIEGLNWSKIGMAALRPAAWGAGIGAVAGGIEGAFSDRETAIGGAFKGALLGGAIGGAYGAGRNIYQQNILRTANRYNNIPFRGKPVGPSGGFGGYLTGGNYPVLMNTGLPTGGGPIDMMAKNSRIIEQGFF